MCSLLLARRAKPWNWNSVESAIWSPSLAQRDCVGRVHAELPPLGLDSWLLSSAFGPGYKLEVHQCRDRSQSRCGSLGSDDCKGTRRSPSVPAVLRAVSNDDQPAGELRLVKGHIFL